MNSITQLDAVVLRPNCEHIRQHLHTVFGNLANYSDGLIEIAYSLPGAEKLNQARYFPIAEIENAVEFAATQNAQGSNIYFGPALRKPSTDITGRSKDSDFYVSGVTWSDIDQNTDPIWSQMVEANCSPSYAITTGTVPENRLHCYFALNQPCTDSTAIQTANKSLQESFKTDAVSNPCRVMRLGGTVSYPKHSKTVKGYKTELTSFHLNSGNSFSIDTIIGLVTPPTLTPNPNPNPNPSVNTCRPTMISVEIQELIANGVPEGQRSEQFHRVVAYLKNMGLSIEQVWMQLVFHPEGIAKKYSGRLRKEIERCYQKAKTPITNETQKIHATQYNWVNPIQIRRRSWLYGYFLIRGFVSLVIAQGAAGKTFLLIADALAMVTGRNLIRTRVHGGPLRVWIWNLEDPIDELQRRIAACCLHYGISAGDIEDRLFVDSGRDQGLCIAKHDKNGVEILEPIVLELVDELNLRQVDVLIVDPFVSSHQVPENDNGSIDAVAKTWGRVTDLAGCAVVLVHHSRKQGGEATNAESARGASSLVAAARSALTLNRMTQKEAEEAGLESPRGYFKLSDDKNNMAPPSAGDARWFHIASIELPNGDNVGAVETWEFPDQVESISPSQLLSVQTVIAGKNYREDPQAADWVGKIIGPIIGIDVTSPHGRKSVRSLIKKWIDEGSLIVVERQDKKRKKRKFIDVGTIQPPVAPHQIVGALQGDAFNQLTCSTTPPL